MINNEVKIRVFGTSNCMYCKELCQGFSLIGVRYEFIDADADENQKIRFPRNAFPRHSKLAALLG